MARIVVGSYMVRYPLGGMLSWVLQWLVGLDRLGHEVTFVEKSGWTGSCYDPRRNVMGDDCSYGVATVGGLLAGVGLADQWCFVDAHGRYHGMARDHVERALASADVFVDMGTHGAWLEEAQHAGVRVLVEAEPGFTQMKMETRLSTGEPLPEYDRYFSIGGNVGTERSTAPTAGRHWEPVFNPVVPELFKPVPVSDEAPFTTVTNWRAHDPIAFGGTVYGQKDTELMRFVDLPARAGVPLELAVSGKSVPTDRLRERGWRLRDARQVTRSVDSYWEYLGRSRGEFSACKHVFVATRSGWFSDRSAAYLASGRPVVVQDTGFGDLLPTGRGLFAVRDLDEATAALQEVVADYGRHARWARELAEEHLAARKVLERFLDELGV